MGGTWVQCHAEVTRDSRSCISAGHQDNAVQSTALTHRVTMSDITGEKEGTRGSAQAPGQPPQGVVVVVVVVCSCALGFSR